MESVSPLYNFGIHFINKEEYDVNMQSGRTCILVRNFMLVWEACMGHCVLCKDRLSSVFGPCDSCILCFLFLCLDFTILV